MYVSARYPASSTNPECVSFLFREKKRFGFAANINIWAKAFCPVFFWSPVYLSECLSLCSHLLCRYVHSHNTLPSPYCSLILKALILSFSYCSGFSSLVVSICKKKEKSNSWVSVFTESYISQCRGSLNFSRSDCCCQYARTHFFINFSKALIILRRQILGPIMPSNSQ